MISKYDRQKMVLAMEFIARQINDEMVFDEWLSDGVADGDIDYGSFDIAKVEDYYTEDDHFRYLMDTFTSVIARARKSGGLYCGGIVGGEK